MFALLYGEYAAHGALLLFYTTVSRAAEIDQSMVSHGRYLFNGREAAWTCYEMEPCSRLAQSSSFVLGDVHCCILLHTAAVPGGMYSSIVQQTRQVSRTDGHIQPCTQYKLQVL